jgi:hypothetical protein
VINWGSNAWWLSGPYGRFTTNSVSFNGAGPTSETLTLIGTRQLVQLDVFNGGTRASTVTLSCAGRPTKSVSVAPGQLMTIQTGWTGTCANVTLSSSNGWDTNFDNLVVQ